MAAKSLEAQVRHQPRVAIIDLHGEINAFAEDVLNKAYAEAESRRAEVILLNFSDVDYINSTGIALIVSLLARARKSKRRLLACGLSDHYVTTSIIDIHGDVSAFAENVLMEAYAEANTPTTRTIILNFAGLEYMNSSGIGLLVTLLIRINRQKQRMYAFGLSEHYRHIFELTRLSDAIKIYENESAALSAA